MSDAEKDAPPQESPREETAPPPADRPEQGGEEVPPESSEPARQSDDDGFRGRHPDALRLQLAVGGCVSLLVAGATLTAATLVSIFALPTAGWRLLVLAAGLFVPVLVATLLLTLPRLEHRRFRYRVDERGLEIRQGIWWRSHRFIPRSRLQHTDVAQGPLERRLGLANLVVHTAGTHEAQTRVSGLARETAYEMRERLSELIADGSDGV